MFCSARECLEDPDLGSGRVYNHSWPGGSRLYKAEIQYTCGQGQAFNAPPYTNSIVGDCKQQTTGSTHMNWKYNDTNNLPDCIREYFFFAFYYIAINILPNIHDMNKRYHT